MKGFLVRPVRFVLAVALAALMVVPSVAALPGGEEGRVSGWTRSRLSRTVDQPSLLPEIAVDGSMVHVVWIEAGQAVWYRRSSDGGATWEGRRVLWRGLSSNAARRLDVAVSGPSVVVTFSVRDLFGGKDEADAVMVRRSADAGLTWLRTRRLSRASENARQPALAVSGGVFHVVYSSEREADLDVFYRRSSDGGASWTSPRRLNNTSTSSETAAIVATGDGVHVVWAEYSGDYSKSDIYYRRSLDGGDTWRRIRRMTNTPVWSEAPVVTAVSSAVAVAWIEQVSSGPYVGRTVRRFSRTDGVRWSAPEAVTKAASSVRDVGVAGTAMVMAIEKIANASTEVFILFSRDGGKSWVDSRRVSRRDGVLSAFPAVAYGGGFLHAVWEDNAPAGTAYPEIMHARSL